MNLKSKVWLVDDDAIYRFAFLRIVKKLDLDIEIESFHDGFDAWKAIQECLKLGFTLPKLILLDINMPIMNGWDFLDQFATLTVENDQKSKIVMVSSSTDPKDSQKSNSFIEVTGYFSKPINNETLFQLLQPYTRV